MPGNTIDSKFKVYSKSCFHHPYKTILVWNTSFVRWISTAASKVLILLLYLQICGLFPTKQPEWFPGLRVVVCMCACEWRRVWLWKIKTKILVMEPFCVVPGVVDKKLTHVLEFYRAKYTHTHTHTHKYKKNLGNLNKINELYQP